MTDTIAATEELKKALAAEEGARRWVRRLAIALGVVLAVGGVGLAWSAQHRPPPPARFTTAAVAIGDVLEKVQATGTVQPLLQVNVGTQVNGRVTQVLVDFNSVVKKGDLLAEIDPLIYGTQVSAQQANLSAQPRAARAGEGLRARAAKAQREIAQVTAERTAEALRAEPREPGAISTPRRATTRRRAPSTRPRWPTSRASRRPSARRPRSSGSRRRTSGTRRSTRRSTASSSRAASTRAPRSQSSFQVAVLFVIAQDLRKMRILADVDEADVGKIAGRHGRPTASSTRSPARSSTARSRRSATARTTSPASSRTRRSSTSTTPTRSSAPA